MRDDPPSRAELEEELHLLRQSAGRHQAYFQSSPIAMFVVDPTGRYVDVNPAACHLLGYSVEELLEMSIRDLTPEHARGQGAPSFAKLKEVGQVTIENRLRRKDGSLIDAALTAVTIPPDRFLAFVEDITERKQADRALRESEERYRNFVTNATEGIYRIDFASQIHVDVRDQELSANISRHAIVGEVNEALARMYGLRPEDMIGRLATDFAPEYGERATLVVRAPQRQVRDVETRDVDKDGNTLLLSESYGAVVEDGILRRIWGMQRDITEQKGAEERLRRSEARFRELAEMLPEVVIETTPDLTLTYANRRAFALFGYSPEDLADGLTSLDLLVPEEHERAKTNLTGPLSGDREGATEWLARRKDGSTFPILFHMSPITEGGDVVGQRGVIVDITERKLVEEALRESEQRLQGVFDSTADYLMLLDRDHRVLLINRVEPGLTREAVIGTPLYELSGPEQGVQIKHHLDRVVQRNERQQYDTTYVRPDGTTAHFSSVAAPILLSGQVAGSVISAREVTDRIELENEKARLEERYRHSQKMEAIGRLAGGVAHDFNNVLCVVTGHAALVLEDLAAGDPLRESIEEIEKAANRAADLTMQLLAFSRKQIIEPKVIDLGHVIRRMHTMLVRLIGEDIILRSMPQKGIGMVRADPGQIGQIVLNLVINARDAMPDGGELLVETTAVTLDEDYCATHTNATPGAFVMLAVSDTGSGMSAEIREKIFEPFFTTKELGQGTGLGLATVFGIVEQNNGGIEVYSEPGIGTTFKVYLPCVDAVEAFYPSATPTPVGGNETVLVVEDDGMVRSLAIRLLKRAGYRVLAAGSATDALLTAQQHEGPIELLLTDVVMPIMNGRDLAVRLTQLRPLIKVLFTSGYTQSVIAHHGVLDEGVQFVAKPYSFDTLSRRVREVLDHPGGRRIT